MQKNRGLNINGILPIRSLSEVLEDEKRGAAERSNQPVILSLADYVRKCWDAAKRAKLEVEQRMLRNLRQRRGEYDPELLMEIKKQGSSEVYMMLTSNKCRAGSAWLRDTLLGARDEKCWTIDPTPVPDLPETMKQTVIAEATQEAMALVGAGVQVTRDMMMQMTMLMKDRIAAEMQEEAKRAAERMERKMEDQLDEGGFSKAFSAFLDDLVTFPSAIMKGPITRRKPRMKWEIDPASGDYSPVVSDELVAEWERVDPFMAYPAPSSTNVDDGYFIERHKLTRDQLNELKGVEGYDDGAITAVLDEHGKGGLHDWLYIDAAKATAEGRNLSSVQANPEATIDALQFWGSVQGKMLVEWGMSEEEVGDLTKEFHCEVWLIGRWVIKATFNYDPFHRKPYYKTSFEEVPGVFWGNAPPDLIRDCQVVCNAVARALSNNVGIASGPQVVYNVDRLPAGEDLTQMYPWKIWQVASDPYGNSAPPVQFFQPQSQAQELMNIYEKFAVLADEYSGIPRYMTGDNASLSGAGRTASGMSMLMGNAGKTIKQVINNIDVHVIKPMIERQYVYNMRYATDPDLKGDINVVARGANSLVVKDAAAQRRSEFLQMALTNPIAQQVVGMPGIAALMHEQAKTLDMDAEAIVPSPEVMRLRQQFAAPPQAPQQGVPAAPPGPQSGQQLMDGNTVTDTFSPQPA